MKLIHVGSIASSEAVGSVGYNISKAALCSYVRSIGRELYKSNVLVTGILPGGFIAPGNAMERFKFKNNNTGNISSTSPIRPLGSLFFMNLLYSLLFLCSKYSSMMGGCMIPVDAGEGKAYQV